MSAVDPKRDDSANPGQPPAPTNHPPALFFIFGGELAERFSYYGMRVILFKYLIDGLNMPRGQANEWQSLFKMACYLLPLLGGWLADRYLGKYWTIVGFSVPYVIGQLLIGIPNETTLLIALGLLAMGSGVIKPNISALLGQTYDQKRPGDQPLRASAFLWFYFAVNIGATISMILLPIIRDNYGYQVAFLFPAGFMAAALALFALGKKNYAKETVGPAPPLTAEEKAEQRKVLTRLFGVFALVVFFWVAYEHNDNLWVAFAEDSIQLQLPGWLGGKTLAPDQFQFINGLGVLILIVFFQWFFKKIDPTGTRYPPTTKVLVGFLFTATAPGLLAVAAYTANGGEKVSMLWIIGAYVLLTLGEVLLYGTMLDLSYAYAPPRMKGFITACFLVTNAIANTINSQFGKMYLGKLDEGEAVTKTMSLGAEVLKKDGGSAFRFYPEIFFGIDAALCVGAAVAFFFVARQFNRGNAKAT